MAIKTVSLNGLQLAYGESIKTQQFTSGSDDALQVEVRLENKNDKSAVTAHQVFLRFTHRETKKDTFFVLLPSDDQTHRIVLDFSLLSKTFSYNSGLHDLELVIGDATFKVS